MSGSASAISAFAASARARFSPGAIFGVVAVLASLAGYGWTLDGYFQGDDFGFVGRYYDFPFTRWPELFVSGWANDLWSITQKEIRPFNALLFMIDARIWGVDPFGFRTTNLLLHATSAALVGSIAWRAAGRSPSVGVIATLVFALHPVHASTVPWITGRVDILSTLFYLAAFLAFLAYREDGHNAWLWLLGLSEAGAIFTKESAIILPILLAAADLLWLRDRVSARQRKTWMPYIVVAAVLAAYLCCRWIAFGTANPGGIGRGLPEPLDPSTYTEFFRREGAYLAHLFPPVNTWLIAWRDTGYPVTGFFLLRGFVLAAVFFASLQWVRYWRRNTTEISDRRAVLFFAFAWFALITGPLMATYFSVRHLYPAAAGLAIALALLSRELLAPLRPFLLTSATLCLVLGLQLGRALEPWHNAAKLSRAIADEVTAAARELLPGGALLLDVPDLARGAFCWSWAVPYSLRPPYTHESLSNRFVVLEAPGTYARHLDWWQQPEIATIVKLEKPCWLIQADEIGTVVRRSIAPEKLRAAAVHLAAAGSGTEFAWRSFIGALGAP